MRTFSCKNYIVLYENIFLITLEIIIMKKMCDFFTELFQYGNKYRSFLKFGKIRLIAYIKQKEEKNYLTEKFERNVR